MTAMNLPQFNALAQRQSLLAASLAQQSGMPLGLLGGLGVANTSCGVITTGTVTYPPASEPVEPKSAKDYLQGKINKWLKGVL